MHKLRFVLFVQRKFEVPQGRVLEEQNLGFSRKSVKNRGFRVVAKSRNFGPTTPQLQAISILAGLPAAWACDGPSPLHHTHMACRDGSPESTGCLKQYVIAPALFGLETERYKNRRKNHVFFTSESSNHQISISPHQSGDKVVLIQNFKVRGPRKFV